jgi:hypothetical protein
MNSHGVGSAATHRVYSLGARLLKGLGYNARVMSDDPPHFTPSCASPGTGRLEEFREHVRWLMVRDVDAEAYSEHHAEGVLEYRFEPKLGIPFPTFVAASGEYPELRVEARVGTRRQARPAQ